MRNQSNPELSVRVIKSPLGPLLLQASEAGLAGLYFAEGGAAEISEGPGTPVLDQAARELEEYFAGKRKEFTIPLAAAGTAFQREVWAALEKIPFGKTLSYAELAQKIGRAKAVRAVGSANGRNPLCIVVPCHRVIAADGSLGGYSGGLERKRRLLALEGPGVGSPL